MNFLEKDLEEIIYSADKELLAEKGLYISGILKRQLRIGNYGTADLVSFARNSHPASQKVNPVLTITIYELKKDKVGISAFLQAIGYAKGIQSYLEKRSFKLDYEFEIVLIGRELDENSTFVYLLELLPCNYHFATSFLLCYTYSYDLNGIKFKQEYGYSLTDEGF